MYSKLTFIRPLVVVCAIATLVACGGGEQTASAINAGSTTKTIEGSPATSVTLSQQADSANSLVIPVPSPVNKNTSSANESMDRFSRATPVIIDLGAPPIERNKGIAKSAESRKPGTAMQLGFAREVVQTKSYGETGAKLKWASTSTGGSIASLGFRSASARGLRVGLLIKTISDKAIVRFYAPDAETAVAVQGSEIIATIQRNIDAGDRGDNGRTYWGPYINGETAIVEIELPLGVSSDTTQIAVPQISHLVLSPSDNTVISNGPKSIGDAGSCNRDISCALPAPIASNSVALMNFMVGGASYGCTGTLLNDKLSSGTSNFLSANHCIPNQTVASSLITGWFYKSSACNSGVLNPNYKILNGGATLLWTRSSVSGANGSGPVGTDTSFMRLNNPPPAGALFAGWSAVPQSPSASIVVSGLHHPKNDLQKISEGSISSFAYMDSDTSGFSSPTSSAWPMYGVNWRSGITEPGSSGSGIFLNGKSNNPQLIGQLWGGSSNCLAPNNADYYGRFDIAYREGLRDWLDGSLIFRFYNTSTGTHFYTITVEERDLIRIKYPQFSYEGPVFSASRISAGGLSSVYRFYNTQTGAHFFTINENERNAVLAKYPQFSPEGVAWYASQYEQPGWLPLYRFYNKVNGTHFFTASAAEKDQVIIKYPTVFTFEGIAYYIKPLN